VEGATAQIAALTLAACFAWAGVAKLARRERWRRSLAAYRLPPAFLRPAAVAVPAAELAVASLLVANARVGAAIGGLLVCAFSLAVVRAAQGARASLPCACFGGAGERDWRVLVARNTALLALATATAVAGPDAGALAGDSSPGSAEALPAALAVAGLALAVWTMRSMRAAFRR
jgi:hypothetical protein